MGLTNEHVGPKVLQKIKIYVLTRAELLFKVCYEIPCITYKKSQIINQKNQLLPAKVSYYNNFSKAHLKTSWSTENFNCHFKAKPLLPQTKFENKHNLS